MNREKPRQPAPAIPISLPRPRAIASRSADDLNATVRGFLPIPTEQTTTPRLAGAERLQPMKLREAARNHTKEALLLLLRAHWCDFVDRYVDRCKVLFGALIFGSC